MICWNCSKEIPDNAKMCIHCEKSVEDQPSAEEIEVVKKIFEEMDPEGKEALMAAIQKADSAEELIRDIFVGDCPQCESTETRDCENDPEIDDLMVGHCLKCGQLWCTECERLFKKGETSCDCYDDEEFEE